MPPEKRKSRANIQLTFLPVPELVTVGLVVPKADPNAVKFMKIIIKT